VHQIKLRLAAKSVAKFWGYMRTYKVSEGYQLTKSLGTPGLEAVRVSRLRRQS